MKLLAIFSSNKNTFAQKTCFRNEITEATVGHCKDSQLFIGCVAQTTTVYRPNRPIVMFNIPF